MGRYLANGIAVEIDVSLKRNRTKKERDLEKIKKYISKYIDINAFDCIENEGGFEFLIDKDYFESNINDLLIEVNELTCVDDLHFDYSCYSNDVEEISDLISDNFKSLGCPSINCKDEDEKRNYYYLDTNLIHLDYQYPYHYWILEDDINDRYCLSIGFIGTWTDFSKYVSEDDSTFLKIFNTLKKNYYKSKLSSCLLYYFFG